MPTRTNGQHSNHLYPNDLFPFTYGESTDPLTGRNDGILRRARASGAVPMVFHVQTSNEYWVRAGSLPHTTPDGSEDAYIPPNVRFYTIGGSQHGSGNGVPRPATSGRRSTDRPATACPKSGMRGRVVSSAGGYIPFPANTAVAVQSGDPRNSITGLYQSFDDYLQKYEAATDKLISEGYLLPGFKQAYMDIARANEEVFE